MGKKTFTGIAQDVLPLCDPCGISVPGKPGDLIEAEKMRGPRAETFQDELDRLVTREIAAAGTDYGRLAAMVGPLSASLSRALQASTEASAAAVSEMIERAKAASETALPLMPPLLQNKIAYSVDEFAKVLSLGKSTVWRLIKDGDVRAKKIGGRTLIPADQVDRVLSRRE
ncbi:helix-turn-helix domain-containing protein [Brevundimonas sp. LM2]|uniref:helix-turn-helix domain-containing protein n=1 Tax=Brevundimonas sp. LM2 TaxID=1938605 RepID=UPI00098456B2|nr:helix-turn-helix domain-containing protein [Brevundimonas sp. LM2]